MYEIFEFLDDFHTYDVFYNLNQRFHNLLIGSKLPLKINFSSISKSSFKQYNKDIIQISINRIRSFHFSYVVTYDFILMSIPKLSEFNRLQALILHNIKCECLQNILDQLLCSSLLSSLTISTIDRTINRDIILQIFRLPVLKYCKLSIEESFQCGSLPIPTDNYSPIEHLIITKTIYLDELHRWLSYVPHIHRLSLCSSDTSFGLYTTLLPSLLDHLINISIEIASMGFDKLEQLLINSFRTVQVLCISQKDSCSSSTFIDAKRWQELIVFHLSNLRVFNIQLKLSIGKNTDNQLQIESKVEHFSSPFWIERQWFFSHYFYRVRREKYCEFYSTNPYRYSSISYEI